MLEQCIQHKARVPSRMPNGGIPNS